ncbi:hypothetical protein JNM87_00115 [Candidatus Saccharibacteria bacterium]|nr:hypothetical protein [Candidatus Saccharibacteria bacterium]
MLKRIVSYILPQDAIAKEAVIRRNIKREAAKIGGNVFGAIPHGTRREFFCLDEHTWVWHEEWTDTQKNYHVRTTRYDVRPHGIFKAQDGQPYRPVSEEEAERLVSAAQEYERLLHAKFDPLLAAA